jgi:tryptophan synthase beta chain
MTTTLPNTYRGGPDEHGRFGPYGGRFVAETLMPPRSISSATS